MAKESQYFPVILYISVLIYNILFFKNFNEIYWPLQATRGITTTLIQHLWENPLIVTDKVMCESLLMIWGSLSLLSSLVTDYTDSITCQEKLWNGWSVHLIQTTPTYGSDNASRWGLGIYFSVLSASSLFLPTITKAETFLKKGISKASFSRPVIPSVVVFSSSRRSKTKANGSQQSNDVLRCTIWGGFLLNEVLSSTTTVSFGQVTLAFNASLISSDIKCTMSVHVTFEWRTFILCSSFSSDDQSKTGYFLQYSTLFWRHCVLKLKCQLMFSWF